MHFPNLGWLDLTVCLLVSEAEYCNSLVLKAAQTNDCILQIGWGGGEQEA